jgi:hypothetical protein
VIGSELLDDPRADPVAVGRELRDIARLNAWFGGTRAVVRELEPVFRHASQLQHATFRITWTLLDIGMGLGDIPRAVLAAARRYGIPLRLIGIELNRTAARLARDSDRVVPLSAIVADGGAPPFAPRSVDIVVVSQVLHHLARSVAIRWIAACDRLARRAVVIADLHRSRLAMAGVWTAGLALGMSRLTRRDAVVSLQRGYTRAEFVAMLREAGVPAVARYRPGSRIVAVWTPLDRKGGT